jgi:signal transduction histidine kinase
MILMETLWYSNMQRLDTLAALFQNEHEALLEEWKNRVRQLPDAERLDKLTLEDNFRSVLDEISTALFQYQDSGTLPTPFTSVEHAQQRFEIGFDINELVIEYAILRHVLKDCALSHNLSLDGIAGTILDKIVDHDIASAVAAHSLEQAAKHEARTAERLADVVHDLKTPLSAIRTASHILERRMTPESKQDLSTMLDIILRNCDSLNAALMKLLEATSRQGVVLPSKPSPTDITLHVLVSEVIQSLSPLIEKTGIPIRNEVPELLHIHADPFLVKQAIQNLVSNAVKYTDQGQISVGASEIEHRIDLWVKDTGSGIAPERLPQVFIRGEGDPGRPESSGLGLAIVKKIVEAHHAEITVQSELGKGSVFMISFPI